MEAMQHLNLDQKSCFYLLTSGKIGVYRKSDDVLVMDISAPMVIDMCGFMMNIDHHYYRTKKPSTLLLLAKKEATLLLDKHALWKDILFLHCFQMGLSYKREKVASDYSHYNIVLRHLVYIWELPSNKRRLTSICLYILSRNEISRSSIYNILCIMKNKDLIRVDRGKLVYLDKSKIT
jgi:hypothetical protein